MSDDIPRQKLIDLRAQLVKDRTTHAANANAADGAIQALDMLLDPPAPAVMDVESHAL